jgi:penicillin-insensitive murein endopeptidase
LSFAGPAFADDLETENEEAAAAKVEPAKPFPFLDDEDPRQSMSIGDVSHGYLANSKPLVESDAIGILPRQKARDLGWGTDELVGLLTRAASRYHTATKTRFWVGDLARREGGDIPWSVSHNSGRDADIALAYLDANDKPVDPPDLVPIDKLGRAREGGLKLDVGRTWSILKALFTDDGVQIQYLFLATHLEQMVLFHAKRIGESPELLERASRVIQQVAAPHDDHIHVRLHCAEHDLEGGCVDVGVVHTGTKTFSGAKARRLAIARNKLSDARPELRRAAALRIGLLGSRSDAPLVRKRLEDTDVSVRAGAAESLGQIGNLDDAEAIDRALRFETDATARVTMLQALGSLGGPASGRAIARALDTPWPACPPPLVALDFEAMMTPLFDEWSDGVLGAFAPASEWRPCDTPEGAHRVAIAAANAGQFAARAEPVEAMLKRLDDEDSDVRVAVARALSWTMNRPTGGDFATMPAEERTKAITTLKNWAHSVPKGARDSWVANGFLAEGYQVMRLDKPEWIWEIARALHGPDYRVFNAQRAIAHYTDVAPAWLTPADPRACEYYIDMLTKDKARLGLSPRPKELTGVCRGKSDKDSSP